MSRSFQPGDRIRYVPLHWQHVPICTERLGTVMQINPNSYSWRGNRDRMWTKEATKVLVFWDYMPGFRTNQTARSWVMAENCQHLGPDCLDESVPVGNPAETLSALVKACDTVDRLVMLCIDGPELAVAMQTMRELVAPLRSLVPAPPVEAMTADEV